MLNLTRTQVEVTATTAFVFDAFGFYAMTTNATFTMYYHDSIVLFTDITDPHYFFPEF